MMKKRSAHSAMKTASSKKGEDMVIEGTTTRNWDDEARRYVEGVAALLIADSRAGPLLAGTEGGDTAEERVAGVLHSLLAERDAWPATALPLREHIIASLGDFTALLVAKYARLPYQSITTTTPPPRVRYL
jgi:hypothetical protein